MARGGGVDDEGVLVLQRADSRRGEVNLKGAKQKKKEIPSVAVAKKCVLEPALARSYEIFSPAASPVLHLSDYKGGPCVGIIMRAGGARVCGVVIFFWDDGERACFYKVPSPASFLLLFGPQEWPKRSLSEFSRPSTALVSRLPISNESRARPPEQRRGR